MSKLRCGVVGVGYLGRFHAQKYAKLNDCDLVGVYDYFPNQSQKIAQEFGTHSFTELSDMLAEVDAVSIAASTKAHYELAKYFLAHGKHVLIEKPITETVEQAKELVQLAEKNQLILQVGHLERFNPAYVAFNQYLSQPQWIEMQRLAPFKKRGSDVDVILDLMIHDLDILLSWVKSPIVDLKAQGFSMMTKEVDLATVVIKFQNNCVANLTASRVHSNVERLTRVYQEQDYYVLNYQEQQLSRYIADPSADDNLFLEHVPIPCVKHDALELQVQSFIDAVIGKAGVMVDGQAGLNALTLALDIQKAIHAHTAEVHFA
jgi:predicted dehydrogenase